MLMRAVCFLLLSVLLASAAWPATPWERYLESPTPENASYAQKAEYTDKASRDHRLFDDLELLEVQVISGDRAAVRLALRLSRDADGHYAETLDIMLGRLIRIKPTMFLREMKSHLDRDRNPYLLDGILLNYGEAYVDKLEAHHYETKKRIEALMSVTDASLSGIRDHCVSILRKQESAPWNR